MDGEIYSFISLFFFSHFFIVLCYRIEKSSKEEEEREEKGKVGGKLKRWNSLFSVLVVGRNSNERENKKRKRCVTFTHAWRATCFVALRHLLSLSLGFVVLCI